MTSHQHLDIGTWQPVTAGAQRFLNKFEHRMLIAGEWVEAQSGARLESRNPATGEVHATIPSGDARDVNAAVAAAREALERGAWPALLPAERARILWKVADLIEANLDELAELESLDQGKPLWVAKYAEIPGAIEQFRYFAGVATRLEGTTINPSINYQPPGKKLFAYTRKEPVGVVAAIVPWNSQLFLVAVKLGPALAAGNTVVLKASEHASAAMLEFGELIEAAGFPPGVVNIVSGFGEPCGRVLTSHPLVARISFTGGPGAARAVLTNSRENFAEVSLELGGKSPFIVFDDADIDSAVNGSIAGIFGATGQSCVAGSRLYLHEDIADEFLAKIVALAKQIRIGDPLAEDTQMGPLCTQGQLANIQREVAHAITEGATVLCGGKQPDGLGGTYYEPTIIDCPRQDLQIVDTELFGPVLSVLRFKTEAEVIALANDTQHGLAAGIFTRDGARQMRMAKAVRSGIVWVNTYRAVSPIAAFGGVKGSGYGRESGFQAMYDYTRAKTVWINTSTEPMAKTK